MNLEFQLDAVCINIDDMIEIICGGDLDSQEALFKELACLFPQALHKALKKNLDSENLIKEGKKSKSKKSKKSKSKKSK